MLDMTDWQNKKYQTRDGHSVRILCVDARQEYSIVGLVEEGGRDVIEAWRSNGSYMNSTLASRDLINAKIKKEGWINIYRGGLLEPVVQNTKEDADRTDSMNRVACIRVACIRIEWEE